MIEINEKEGAITFEVRVQPRASRTEVAGEHGNALKLRLTSPPVDGKANAECQRFIAELLDVPRASVEILQGETSRTKLIRVRNVDASRLREAIAK